MDAFVSAKRVSSTLQQVEHLLCVLPAHLLPAALAQSLAQVPLIHSVVHALLASLLWVVIVLLAVLDALPATAISVSPAQTLLTLLPMATPVYPAMLLMVAVMTQSPAVQPPPLCAMNAGLADSESRAHRILAALARLSTTATARSLALTRLIRSATHVALDFTCRMVWRTLACLAALAAALVMQISATLVLIPILKSLAAAVCAKMASFQPTLGSLALLAPADVPLVLELS